MAVRYIDLPPDPGAPMRRTPTPCFALILAAAGCGGGATGPTPPPPPPPPPAPAVAAVTISPQGLTLPVGGQGQLAADAKAANGATVGGVAIGWTSRAPNVATVTNTGLVTGVAAGQTEVIAAAQGKADTVLVVVLGAFQLVVTPGPAAVDIGKSAAFAVEARDGSGLVIPTPPVSWGSSAPTIATVSGSGISTGVAAGVSTISARSGTVLSNGALLTVRDTTSASRVCNGVLGFAKFEGTIDYGYKSVGQQTDGGFLIDADDNGILTATLVKTSDGPFLASWSGDIHGSASTTQRKYDGSNSETRSGGGPIIGIPLQFGGAPVLPKMTLIADLQLCTWRLTALAMLSVRQTYLGTTTQKEEPVAMLQFSSIIGDPRLGLLLPTGSLTPRSLVWGVMHPTDDAVMPLGFAAELFNPIDRSVGQGTGGMVLVPKP